VEIDTRSSEVRGVGDSRVLPSSRGHKEAELGYCLSGMASGISNVAEERLAYGRPPRAGIIAAPLRRPSETYDLYVSLACDIACCTMSRY
jgi:hypothetical protein